MFACVYADRETWLVLNERLGSEQASVAPLDTPAWRAACRAWAEGRLATATPGPDTDTVARTGTSPPPAWSPVSLWPGLLALLSLPLLVRVWRWRHRRAARRAGRRTRREGGHGASRDGFD